MNREQKINVLKALLAGKPMREGMPLIKICLMPHPTVRPVHLLPFISGCADYGLTIETRRKIREVLYPQRLVRRGEETQFEEKIKAAMPQTNVVVGYGMSDEEYDAIVSKLEKEF